jgi:putative endonuclease
MFFYFIGCNNDLLSVIFNFITMYYFYILFSEKIDRYYYGSSKNPEIRIKLHNAGATRSTKSGIPWKLIYIEQYQTKSEAIKREKEIKRIRKRSYIENLIKQREP